MFFVRVSFGWNWTRIFEGNKRDDLIGGVAEEKRDRRMTVASSLRENKNESVSKIAIRLKIPSSLRDFCCVGIGRRQWKFFPNDRSEVVTVNLDQTDHPYTIVSPLSLPSCPFRHSSWPRNMTQKNNGRLTLKFIIFAEESMKQ